MMKPSPLTKCPDGVWSVGSCVFGPIRLQRSRRSLAARASDEGSGNSSTRQPWDFPRFVRTVTFFNEMPAPQEMLTNLLQQPLQIIRNMIGGQSVEEQKTSALRVLAPEVISPGPGLESTVAKPAVDGVVLVTGATAGVGRRVVRELLKRGAVVRALVRDLKKAEETLKSLPRASGSSLEVVTANISQKQTLSPEYFKNVRAVVDCSSAIVAKGGIVKGETPEAIDFIGRKNVMDKCKDSLGLEDGVFILDSKSARNVNEWGALDDVVMGGCSVSKLELKNGAGENGAAAAIFSGNVTSANSGGFASVRNKNFKPVLDLGAYDGIEIRVLGDGQRYKLNIRTDSNWDGLAYCKSFDTESGVWQTIRLPFSDFCSTFRARTVKDAANLDSSSIVSVQLMLSKFEYDGKLNPNFRLGEFSLPISYIKSYMKDPLVARYVLCSSAAVTRYNRPGEGDETKIDIVRLNEQCGSILTYKLKGEDVIRDSGVPFAVVRPVDLTDEPAGAPLEFDQGDMITGKISRDDVAELCVEALSRPSVCNTTFEVRSTVPIGTPYEPDAKTLKRERDWEGIIGGVNLQKGVTGKTIDGVYTGRNAEKKVE